MRRQLGTDPVSSVGHDHTFDDITVNGAPMANVDNDVTPSFRVTPSYILIVSLWLVVVLCPPINVLKLPTFTSVYLCE